MLSRLALLFSLTWIMKLSTPLLPPIAGRALTGRDLILILGGLFLIFKATRENHHKVEDAEKPGPARQIVTVAGVLGQVLVVDLVFSLDSVITAVGMVDDISIMVAAVIISVAIMMLAAGPLSRFVDRHPTVKILALAFLLLIGVTLIAEGWQFHVPKGYVYFAMAFSIAVEMLNIRASAVRKRQTAPASSAPASSNNTFRRSKSVSSADLERHRRFGRRKTLRAWPPKLGRLADN